MSLNSKCVLNRRTKDQPNCTMNRFSAKFGDQFAEKVLCRKLTVDDASFFLNRHRVFERQYLEYCHEMLKRMKKIATSVNPVGPEVQLVYDDWFGHSADMICDFIDEIRSYFNLNDKETGEFVFCCAWRKLQQAIDSKMEETRDKFIAEIIAKWAVTEAVNG